MTTETHKAYIGLGSNLGNRKNFLRTAINDLPNVTQISQLYETAPVGYDDQGPFLNLIVELETELSPKKLLELCQAGEKKAERLRTIKNGPRTLDLDLLYVEGHEVNEPDLIVPHPRMFERGFVIIPLSDLNLVEPLAEQTRIWLTENKDASNGIWIKGTLNLDDPAHQILKTKSELTKHAEKARKNDQRIGFVPTMGDIHQGHLELIKRSQAENDLTIVSIFVNPLQFNETSDYENYPKDLERDIEYLESFEPLTIFIPEVEEMYPEESKDGYPPNIGNLAEILEAKNRPGHFEGVYTIVSILFSIVGECTAYLGEKDYQQYLVISKLVEDIGLPIKITACPTIRESTGLALSSRNALLEEEHKNLAVEISAALFEAKELIESGKENDPKRIEEKIEENLMKKLHEYNTLDNTLDNTEDSTIELEYVAVRETQELEPIDIIEAPVRILIAAQFGEVRLIDNMGANPPS